MRDIISAIFDFNRSILKVPQTDIKVLTEAETAYLRKCLEEEAQELSDAHVAGNLIGQVDACVDSLYFAVGGLCRMGLTVDQVYDSIMAVHEANMTKKKGVNAKRDMGVSDAVKPEGWVPPEERLAEILSHEV